MTTQPPTPNETDILRFVVAMCTARDDEDLVGRVIKDELDQWPEFLHASTLQVALRVVVAQMYGALARRIEGDGDPFLVDQALEAQGFANEVEQP